MSLVDAFERPLVERTVRLQAEPGVQEIELEAPDLHHFRVHVTANGQDVVTGSVRAVPTGAERGNYFPIRAGEAHVGPTTAGTYDLEIQVQGRPSQRIEACELAPGAPPLVIDLER